MVVEPVSLTFAIAATVFNGVSYVKQCRDSHRGKKATKVGMMHREEVEHPPPTIATYNTIGNINISNVTGGINLVQQRHTILPDWGGSRREWNMKDYICHLPVRPKCADCDDWIWEHTSFVMYRGCGASYGGKHAGECSVPVWVHTCDHVEKPGVTRLYRRDKRW
ncbi:hypothetical protein EJ08DRAFT_684227 [Tothia fuscella]|uniref:Uncharacterized protein n=1 Tax=Tothia fuscella TaxID=1048955 RepID=A0A9P4NE42_9PEZI|nr:hypothetical protein EJ08DRAFT_684227 [Tothia fuscella]